MRREKVWMIVAFLTGLIVQILLSAHSNSDQLQPWVLPTYGWAIALAILGVVTLINRFRVAPIESKGVGADFVIRPVRSIAVAAICFLTIAGALFLPAYFTSNFERDFSKALNTLPIWAMGFALIETTYSKSKV